MDFLKDIKPNSLLIIPDHIKEKVLSYLSKEKILTNVKLLSLHDLEEIFYFSHDDNALYYLMKKHGYRLAVARLLLRNLRYLDSSSSKQMNELRTIKQELEEENLLSKKEMSLQKFEYAYLFGYDGFTKFEKNLLEKVSNFVKITQIPKKKNGKRQVYEVMDKEEEILFVFEKISDLLKEGVPLSNIILTNVNEKDRDYFKKFASYYHIPFSIPTHSYAATEAYQRVKKEIIEGIEGSPSIEKDILIQRLNHMIGLSKEDMEVFLDDFAKTMMIDEMYENSLRIEPLCDNVFQEEDHVFILSSTLQELPLLKQDDDFLYDAIKPEILEKTEEKNSLLKAKTKAAIDGIMHAYFTYPKKEGDKTLSPSSLIKEDQVQKIDRQISKNSHKINQRTLVRLLDQKRKYYQEDAMLASLENVYPLRYNCYQNDFKPWNASLPEDLTLSYSSLQTFYECKFKFYLDYFLKLNPFETNFNAYLGTFVHDMLEHCYEKDFDLSKQIHIFEQENPFAFTEKEAFFFTKTKERIQEIIDFLKDFEMHTKFKKKEVEKKLYWKTGDKISITFMGIADKILFYQNQIALIDYKTGHPSVNLKHMQYGLDIQLPIYLLLLQKNYPNKEVTGFFLQHVLEGPFRYERGKEEKILLRKSMKLTGYLIDEEEKIKDFDASYHNSFFIQGLSKTEDGFSRYTKTLSKQGMNDLILLAQQKIEDMVKEIENWNFTIDPKIEKTKKISCEYCPYKSICYVKKEDFIPLEKEEEDGENEGTN